MGRVYRWTEYTRCSEYSQYRVPAPAWSATKRSSADSWTPRCGSTNSHSLLGSTGCRPPPNKHSRRDLSCMFPIHVILLSSGNVNYRYECNSFIPKNVLQLFQVSLSRLSSKVSRFKFTLVLELESSISE